MFKELYILYMSITSDTEITAYVGTICAHEQGPFVPICKDLLSSYAEDIGAHC